jgi:hypothetical protein
MSHTQGKVGWENRQGFSAPMSKLAALVIKLTSSPNFRRSYRRRSLALRLLEIVRLLLTHCGPGSKGDRLVVIKWRKCGDWQISADISESEGCVVVIPVSAPKCRESLAFSAPIR